MKGSRSDNQEVKKIIMSWFIKKRITFYFIKGRIYIKIFKVGFLNIDLPTSIEIFCIFDNLFFSCLFVSTNGVG